MSATTRTEKDPLGPKEVPTEALYGVQTLRAKENFPISGLKPLWPFVMAQVWIKKAAAMTHKETGRLDAKLADAIIAAADEVLAHPDVIGAATGAASPPPESVMVYVPAGSSSRSGPPTCASRSRR